MTTISPAKIFVLVAGLLASCTSTPHVKSVEQTTDTGRSPWTSIDTWYSPVPDSYGYHDSTISRKHVHELDSLHTVQCMKLLETKTIIPLSRKEVSDLGVKLDAGASLKPYLVRALYLNYYTGGYEVTQSDDTLVVLHGSLGHHAVPMTRSCLIVELKNEPHVLYVEVSMAE